MTAKNGKPCKKCGSNEWYTSGKCAPCERERTRRWAKNNPEKAAAQNRRWRQVNPEKAAACSRRWAKANPEKAVAKVNRRRTRKTQAGGSYTAAEWEALVEYYGGKCLCCGRTDVELTVDHIVPVSKGGSSNIDNIQPLCLSCNSHKRAKHIDYRPKPGILRWIQKKLFD